MAQIFTRRKLQLEPNTLSEPEQRFRREPLEVIARKDQRARYVADRLLQPKEPVFKTRIPRPEQLAVMVYAMSVGVVFVFEVAEQSQVEEIGASREEIERRFSLVFQRSDVRPDPAHAVFLEQVNDAREVPVGVSEFDGPANGARQPDNEFAQGELVLVQREIGRQLDEHAAELVAERPTA